MFKDISYIADFYKYNHRYMYPKDMSKLYSVMYVRNPKMDLNYTNGYIIVFGVKTALTILDSLLSSTKTDIDIISKYLDKGSVETLKTVLNKGYHLNDLLDISHVPDGTALKPGQAILTVENKDKEYLWLVSFIETFLTSFIWKSSFVATQAAKYKIIETKYCGSYYDDSFLVHDFSARGMSTPYDAMFSNAAHLMYFNGTDTVSSIVHMDSIYPKTDKTKLAGTSVYATEHSVMCSWGKERELESYISLINDPNLSDNLLSIVSDTWDLFGIINALNEDKVAKESILKRKLPIVIRPDSGDPIKIMLGDKESDDINHVKGVLELVHEFFGFNNVRTIYGDAITPERFEKIINGIIEKGYKPHDCFCAGVGAYTYNYGTRDSVGIVMKATHGTYEQEPKTRDLLKSPKTDSNKMSLTGRVSLVNDNVNLENLEVLRSYAKNQLLNII